MNRDGIPLQSPEQIQPIDQNYRLVQADLGPRKWLANAIGGGNRIAIHNRDMQSSGMAVGHKRLM
jgi:hypothetical protein